MFETEPAFWERQLDALAGDTRINRKLPEITARSGNSDRAALRILRLLDFGVLGITHLWVFTYRSFVKHLSEPVFHKVVDVLLTDSSSFAASMALDVVDFRYCRREAEQELPEILAYKD